MRIKLFFTLLSMYSLFFPNHSIGKERSEIFRDRIQTAVKALSSDAPFIYYDLLLSDGEINTLKNLKINNFEQYNNYGNLEALQDEVLKFILLLSLENKNIAKGLSQMVVRIVKDVVQGSGQETAWVTLRSFTPMSLYDTPRWHTDGYYYSPYSGNPYKFVITLKGPSTLFYKLPKKHRKKFFDLQNAGTEQNEFNRQVLATMLRNSKKLVSIIPSHQGAVYIVGSTNAAVHSEPPITEERLFLSILPGKREQIQEWKASQGSL